MQTGSHGIDDSSQRERRIPRNPRRRLRGTYWTAVAAASASALLGQQHHLRYIGASAFAVPPPVVDFGLGAVSGAAGTFAAYPFDYVKSQLQSESGRSKYRNGADCLVRTLREEGGVPQLYRGCVAYVTGLAPEKAIKLSVNDWMLGVVVAVLVARGEAFETVPLWGQMLAGSVAGLLQFVVTTPIEFVKLGLQTSDSTPLEILRRAGGAKGLYRGAGATVVRDVVFTAVLFPTKVQMSGYLYDVINHGQPSLFCEFLAASSASVIASILATPADVIKTRMQTEGMLIQTSDVADERIQMKHSHDSTVLMETELVGHSQEEKSSLFDVGLEIIRNEGLPVMFTGVLQRCLGSVPRFGVTLTLFDYLKHFVIDHGYLL